ncbi:MAG: CHASE2 domain-containing protein [Nitrospiraceae bacterium]|nr:CHASE2 domain-containing protein [Nitrospiraceae bacterium]
MELVAVDQESLNKVGRWPWPRATQARLIENLRAGGAKVIAFDFSLSESDPAVRVWRKCARCASATRLRSPRRKPNPGSVNSISASCSR